MSHNTGRYMHIRKWKFDFSDKLNYDSKGGITLYITEEADSFFVGISMCSKKDIFCKKTGREVAFRQWQDMGDHCAVIPKLPGINHKTIRRMFEQVLEYKQF